MIQIIAFDGKTVLFNKSFVDEGEAKALIEQISRPTGRSRPVYVSNVYKDFENYVEGSPDRPSNGNWAKPVFDGMTFPSAKAASDHLGFKYNEVSQALGRVKNNPDPTERKVVLRGVELFFEEDFLETIKD